MSENIPNEFHAGILTKARNIEVLTFPLPKMKDDEVIIRQETCNICTTDYQHWAGLREHQGYPAAGGHEGAGIIIAKGDKVGKGLQIGDRIGVTYEYCGFCKECRIGNQLECENKTPSDKKSELGHLFGLYGFGDYYVRQARFLIKMSNDLDPAEAGFLEPVATVVHGIRRLRIQPMETVAVLGAGTMGLVNAQVARAFGTRVIVSELMENKIEVAKTMGFEIIDSGKEDPIEKIKALTDGHGADALIVAVGATKAYEQALQMIRIPIGRILIFAAGYPAPEMKVDPNHIHYGNYEVIGTYGAAQPDFYDAARLLNQRMINVKPLARFGDKYSLADIQKAFEAATVPGSYRVTVNLS
jgi:L-iditol 2-dehydrogenase